MRRAAGLTRPPVAFLESLPAQYSGDGGRLTTRFILTDAGDAAIAGATVRISMVGSATCICEVVTDSHGLAEHEFEVGEPGFVNCQATALVRAARIYSSDMVQHAEMVPEGAPLWRRVWLEREAGTHRIHVFAEPMREEPAGWRIYFRPSPSIWFWVTGEGRSPEGRLATIDEREVWPGPCPVRVSASDGRRLVGEELVWFDAAGGPYVGLLVEADPPVERNGESWSRLVIVMFGGADSRLVALGVKEDRDLSEGVVDPADVCSLGYGELLNEGQTT